MLGDSQRDNIDLKACACEEKSVVITPGQNVNVIAELVFDMMMNGGLEVARRSAFYTIPS